MRDLVMARCALGIAGFLTVFVPGASVAQRTVNEAIKVVDPFRATLRMTLRRPFRSSCRHARFLISRRSWISRSPTQPGAPQSGARG
jgi:hypothetical protein